LRAERVAALGLCMLGKFFYDNFACHQALGCAYGDKTRLVLEQTMLWNGQHWQSNKDITGGSKTFQAGGAHIGGGQDKHEQRTPADLTFRLMQCQLLLMHEKQVRQILVQWIWCMKSKLDKY
jgi:hypothetical protein